MKPARYIKTAAYAYDNRHIEALSVALAPDLLKWGRHTNEQDVRPAGPDLLDDL